MLTRLTHAAIAFAITVVVYQVYVLAVVPFVEPELIAETPGNVTTEQQRLKARQVLHRHRDLFAAYFPPGHWTLTKPPKTFESGKAMIVLDDYQPNDNGKLRVNRCVVLFFPKERVRGEPAPRETIVLEAPHGAVLQMDEGFRPGLGGIGKFQSGMLLGEITVRSDMREPGPQDDLLLKTRDLYMDADLIRTNALVEMQLGPHRGQGRQLELRLVAVERAKSGVAGPNIGGVESLKIMHDVQAQFTPGKDLPLEGIGNASSSSAPVKVTSLGPFTFDFAHQVASFDKNVELTQVHATGERDQLLCNRLNLYFVGEQETVAPTDDRTVNINAMATTSKGIGKLRPGLLEALGSDQMLVSLNAESQQATAECQTLRLELDSRRITFTSDNEVELTYQGNEIHALMLQYQAPAENSPQRVGTLLAAGSGWIRGKSEGKPGKEPFEVRWTESMRLQRINGQPVLSLNGRPRLTMVGLGQLWANNLRVYLRERAVDGSEEDLLPADVVPVRMVASGSVEIDSAELHCTVSKMDVQINYAPSGLVLGRPDGNNPRTGRPVIGQRSGNRSRAYEISGDQLQMLLTVRDRQPEVTSIDVDRNVVFQESTPANDGSEPLLVQGSHVRIENADTPSAEITLEGSPSLPATITAADMSMSSQSLKVNRGTSHAWINAPGELRLPIKQDLNGKQLAGPQYLMVSWQGGMTLERDVITFQGHVVASTNEGSLQTEQLVLRLTAPVQFDGAARQQQVELAQFECRDGVEVEFSQRDEQGLTSVQKMQMRSFVADQQTGELRGAGPGWLESVHLSSSTSSLGAFGKSNPVVPSGSGQHLKFLRVEFDRGMRGNMNAKHVELFGNAKAIYGPVDAWEQRLELSVHRDPGPGTTVISADKLAVAESPNASLNRTSKMGPMELWAEGNVIIDGSFGANGLFNARAHKARYDQQKTIFILEGDGRQPATLTRQEYVGDLPSELSLQKLSYNQSTGVVKGEGFSGGNFKQFDIGRQPATPGQPRSR